MDERSSGRWSATAPSTSPPPDGAAGCPGAWRSGSTTWTGRSTSPGSPGHPGLVRQPPGPPRLHLPLRQSAGPTCPDLPARATPRSRFFFFKTGSAGGSSPAPGIPPGGPPAPPARLGATGEVVNREGPSVLQRHLLGVQVVGLPLALRWGKRGGPPRAPPGRGEGQGGDSARSALPLLLPRLEEGGGAGHPHGAQSSALSARSRCCQVGSTPPGGGETGRGLSHHQRAQQAQAVVPPHGAVEVVGAGLRAGAELGGGDLPGSRRTSTLRS